jgi:TetR/AcrR family transcriptional regulator, regulator of cefoperazone and chloramphenicol sensitivity
MEGSDATKDRLLQAAGEEFAEKGFECARIRTICDRAQANVAAVNYHFGDKEQLYVQAVLEAHRCGIEAGEELDDETSPPAEQLRRYVRNFLVRVLALHDSEGWQQRLVIREMLHPTTASDVLIREAIRPRFEHLQRILRRFCPEADDRKLHALAFSVIGQCFFYKMGRPIAVRLVGPTGLEALDLEYLTEHITSFCLAALSELRPLNPAGVTAADDPAAKS